VKQEVLLTKKKLVKSLEKRENLMTEGGRSPDFR